VKDGRIVFLCRADIENSIATQTFVWSDKSFVRGYARKFMHYVLKEIGIIRTSKTQRPLGIEMWKKFIVECLHSSNYVYWGNDFSSLHQISRVTELDKHYSDIWGNSSEHGMQHKHVSTKPLM